MSVYVLQAAIWLLILCQMKVCCAGGPLRLDPKLTSLGDHMYMPELLAQLTAIGGHHHSSKLRPCDAENESIVSQCGIKDLLKIFFPVVQPTASGEGLRVEENLGVKIKPEFLVEEMCSAYSQFDRCLAGFGIRQTCVPRYLSTVDVMVGYSCGQGRNALVQSLDCISNKMTTWAVADAVGNTPGCSRAVPTNLLMRITESWFDLEEQYPGNGTIIPIQDVMAMVCVQWNIYNQCYLPGYAYLCGDVTESYFSGLHQAVVAMVTKILTEMGPEYAKLSSCKQQTILPEYIALKVSLAIYRPKFARWVNEYSKLMHTYAQQLGVCSGAAISARLSYCYALGMKEMPDLPKYKSVDTFPKLGTWLCKGTFDEVAKCYDSVRGNCELETHMPLTKIVQNSCKIQNILQKDPQVFCFAWDQILTDPRYDFFTPCNMTLYSVFDTALYVMENYRYLDFCNETIVNNIIMKRVQLPTLCMLERAVNVIPKALHPHCGNMLINTFTSTLKESIQFLRSNDILLQMIIREHCP